MGIQNGYNIESQKLGQQNNKDLWDYTNYENQRAHLENAGLNAALLYGQSGGGGMSAGGWKDRNGFRPIDPQGCH